MWIEQDVEVQEESILTFAASFVVAVAFLSMAMGLFVIIMGAASPKPNARIAGGNLPGAAQVEQAALAAPGRTTLAW